MALDAELALADMACAEWRALMDDMPDMPMGLVPTATPTTTAERRNVLNMVSVGTTTISGRQRSESKTHKADV